MGELSDAFLERCSASEWREMDDLESWVSERIAAAQPATLGADEIELAALLGERAARALITPELSVAGGVEWCLAAACIANHGRAFERFRVDYLNPLDPALRSHGLDSASIDDLKARVIDKLLLPTDGVTRLEEYAGEGRLRGLVKVVATRMALDELRRQKRRPIAKEADLDALPDPERDPELAYLKAKYRADFRASFAEAATRIDSRARNLMRLHLLSGVTLEQLAKSYGVHRATVVRWLAKARADLLLETEKEMRSRLGVSKEELDSVMGLIGSRLEASVARVFRSEG